MNLYVKHSSDCVYFLCTHTGAHTQTHTLIHTNEQENEDGDGHHEWRVSIERDGLDDPGLKDLIPPEGQTQQPNLKPT